MVVILTLKSITVTFCSVLLLSFTYSSTDGTGDLKFCIFAGLLSAVFKRKDSESMVSFLLSLPLQHLFPGGDSKNQHQDLDKFAPGLHTSQCVSNVNTSFIILLL